MGRVAAGRMNRRVTIQRKSGTVDSWGQPNISWIDVATVWARVLTITGSGFVNNEMITGGTEVSRTTASIRVRMRRDIDAGMRVVLGESIYDIRAVLPDEEGNEYLDLACALGASEG
jgi:SPP1 family predicted phage head-tail adaptor